MRPRFDPRGINMACVKPHNDEPENKGGIQRPLASVWLESLSGCVLCLLIGLLAGVLFVPGDGNPGHILSVAVIGLCGLLLWVGRKGSILTSAGLCFLLMVVCWPIAIVCRDATSVLMPDFNTGHLILGWLRRLLPAALLVVGTARWTQSRNWAVLLVAVLPFSAQMGYIMFRSPLAKQIDRIEWCGIMVIGGATEGYGISVIHDKGDNVVRAAFADMKVLPGLRRAHIRSKKITDASLCLLSKLPEIESLELDSMPISRKAVECISQMRRLRSLWLLRVSCEDDDIAPLIDSKSLERLVIGDCALGDAAVGHIAQIKTLKSVSFVDTRISVRAVEDLKSKRPDLRVE